MNSKQTTRTTARAFNTLIAAVEVAEAKKESTSWNAEAYEAAQAELKAAYAALSEAIKNAEWGANGAVFVTQRTTAVASGAYNKKIWVNRRVRATRYPNGRVEVYSAAQAEAEFHTGRAERNAQEARYMAQLEELGRLLWRLQIYSKPTGDFGVRGWEFVEGQHGGYFHSVRKDENGNAVCVSVSARGAFRRAAKIFKQCGPYRQSPWRF